MQNTQKAAYAAKEIAKVGGLEIAFSAPKFNEFVVRSSKPAEEILKTLRKKSGIIGGLALSKYYADRPNEFLVCVTETVKKEKIDTLVSSLTDLM